MSVISVVSEVRWDWTTEGMPDNVSPTYYLGIPDGAYTDRYCLDYLREEAIIDALTFNQQTANLWALSYNFNVATPYSIADNTWKAFDWTNRQVIFYDNNISNIKYLSLDNPNDPFTVPPITTGLSLSSSFYYANLFIQYSPNCLLVTSYSPRYMSYYMSLYPLTNVPSYGPGFYQFENIAYNHPDLLGTYGYPTYYIMGYNHFEQAIYVNLGGTVFSTYKLLRLRTNDLSYHGTTADASSFDVIGNYPVDPATKIGSSLPVCVFVNSTGPGLLSWWRTQTSGGGSNGLELFRLVGTTWQSTGVTCPFPVQSVSSYVNSFDYTYFNFSIEYGVNQATRESWRVCWSTGEWESLFTSPRGTPTGATFFKPPGKKEYWGMGGLRFHQDEIDVWDSEGESWNYPVGFWSFLNMRSLTPYFHPNRSDAAIAYDDVERRYLLMGGRETNQLSTFETAVHNDLWEFIPDTYTWTQVIATGDPLPEPRSGHSFVYNKMDGCFYLYGGVSGLLPVLTTPFPEVWKLDQDNVWSVVEHFGAAVPTPRYIHGSIIRTVNNSLYILGGNQRDGTSLFDFWRFDLHKRLWSLITQDIRLDTFQTFTGPIKCVYDENRDAMYVMSSGGDVYFLSYYFATKHWNRATYGLEPQYARDTSGFFYDSVDDELSSLSLGYYSIRGRRRLVRHTQIETEPHALPVPEFALPVKKICETDRTKMIPMDDCAWWWEGSDKSPFLDLEERACKVGSVRVRYSKYKRVKDHPLAFFSQILEGGPNLYLDHEGISCRFQIPDDFVVDSNYPEGDFDNIVIVPDSDMYEPILLDSTRNNEVILDQSGYKSGDYNVYVTSFDPLWDVLKDGYLGTAVLSKEEPNTGSHLRGRIDGVVVYAKKVGKVKLKMSLNKDKFMSDPYIGEDLELVPGTGRMKKIALSGSDSFSYVGLMNCCAYWQSHYVSGSPIYLAVEFLTDDEVIGYDFSVVLRSCVLPKTVDLDGMVRSGRIEAPPFPERYFHTTYGSSEAPMSYGTQLPSEAKWYQISSDNGMIGGIMPSVGDAILIEILMQPPSLVQKEFSSIYKSPVGISSASIRVKHTSDIGYIKTQRSNFDQVPRIPQDLTIPTVTSTPSGEKGTHFFLNLTDAVSEDTNQFLDAVQSRVCVLDGDATVSALQNPGGSNLSVCLGNSTNWTACINTDPNAMSQLITSSDQGAEYLYPEDQFILSSYLYLDVDNANSTGYDITCTVDLLRVGIERNLTTVEDLPVDSYFYQPSWGYFNASSAPPVEGHYLSCAFSVLRTRYFFLFWGCDHLYLVPDAVGFRLDPLSFPYNEWFKLTLTRNRTTNEYAWLLNDVVIKDEFGKDCRWTSKTYWYSSPSTERYRGSASAETSLYPKLLDSRGVTDAYIYACYYQLDKFNTLI
jgi:hypothetical protein